MKSKKVIGMCLATLMLLSNSALSSNESEYFADELMKYFWVPKYERDHAKFLIGVIAIHYINFNDKKGKEMMNDFRRANELDLIFSSFRNPNEKYRDVLDNVEKAINLNYNKEMNNLISKYKYVTESIEEASNDIKEINELIISNLNITSSMTLEERIFMYRIAAAMISPGM